MDVLSIIKQEHRDTAALLDQVEDIDPGDQRLMSIAREVEQKLSTHLAIEERLFYNELRRRAEEAEQTVDLFEAFTEHAVAKQLMQMLSGGRKPDERFKAELQVLGESVKHHVQEEESTVFGIARKLLGSEELGAIGEAWERARKRGQSQTSRAGSAARKKTARKTPARKTATRATAARRTRS